MVKVKSRKRKVKKKKTYRDLQLINKKLREENKRLKEAFKKQKLKAKKLRRKSKRDLSVVREAYYREHYRSKKTRRINYRQPITKKEEKIIEILEKQKEITQPEKKKIKKLSKQIKLTLETSKSRKINLTKEDLKKQKITNTRRKLKQEVEFKKYLKINKSVLIEEIKAEKNFSKVRKKFLIALIKNEQWRRFQISLGYREQKYSKEVKIKYKIKDLNDVILKNRNKFLKSYTKDKDKNLIKKYIKQGKTRKLRNKLKRDNPQLYNELTRKVTKKLIPVRHSTGQRIKQRLKNDFNDLKTIDIPDLIITCQEFKPDGALGEVEQRLFTLEEMKEAQKYGYFKREGKNFKIIDKKTNKIYVFSKESLVAEGVDPIIEFRYHN